MKVQRHKTQGPGGAPGDEPSGLYDPDPVPDEDLWFLPGPVEEDEEAPPGTAPAQRAATLPLFDPAPWRAAQAELAPELAEVAGLFGALDQRLHAAPAGWLHRLALREVSDLGWWSGDRLAPERIALWLALRIGSTEDTGQALARAGWAVRHLTSGPSPREDAAGFLERVPRPDDAAENATADLADILAAGTGLHPIVDAARVFHAWRALGPETASGIEAAVLAARHGAMAARRRGRGALFLPLAQTGGEALRGQGAAAARLAAWLRGAERATLAALLHLDRVEDWRRTAESAIADLSGRTPRALIDILEGWPCVTAPMAETLSGASRAAVQRNLDRLQQRGLVRELTGQGRYRVWGATL